MDVYKKRTTQLELNTAVSILADHSGSMAGDKYAHACKAGLMLNEAMGKIGVPVELLGFSEDGRGPINVIIKPFTEVTAPQSELQERYASAGSWMCQNSDGESIVWAFNRLRKRKEKRRILIVLSDGSPAAYNGSSMAEYYYTQQVVESIEEDTPIEIYGIGIMDDNVKRIYKDHKVLHHADDLENMLLGLVKNKVLGIK
jgi:cobalamin biosynthesis protein CobT